MSAASTAGLVVLFTVAASGVAATQPRLARTVHEVKERDDVVTLPAPAELRAAVLGWDAAAVDMLWAKLLVEYGTHSSEHRDFTGGPRYLDAILELEPTYDPVYRYVDTLLAYRPIQGTEADARMARAYLEHGTVVRPDDPRMWTRYGQFLAYLGPSFVTRPEDRAAWRRDGAAALGHAVELGADADGALQAASLLTDAGNPTAAATRGAIRYLEHAYAFTEHPTMLQLHESIGRKLEQLQGTVIRAAADDALRTVDQRWQRELRPVSRDVYLLIGPIPDVARCAGVAASDDGEAGGPCARAWSQLVHLPDEAR